MTEDTTKINLNDIQSALFDAYDIRNSSDFKSIQNKPKDNEGTVFTLADCIHDIIYTLERVEKYIETNAEDERQWKEVQEEHGQFDNDIYERENYK
tara:strand:- start:299 stop:586 length:288 start_codon:yes stop_codon:yes gene_type:complete